METLLRVSALEWSTDPLRVRSTNPIIWGKKGINHTELDGQIRYLHLDMYFVDLTHEIISVH
jgi:hypothetical protein